MKRAIVKLNDGTIYQYDSQYIWGYENEINDNRTEFIKIGDLIVKKSSVISIQINELTEEKMEVETNE